MSGWAVQQLCRRGWIDAADAGTHFISEGIPQ
jgi:hypothetical protein